MRRTERSSRGPQVACRSSVLQLNDYVCNRLRFQYVVRAATRDHREPAFFVSYTVRAKTA